jgi:hypothetical protein
LHQTIKGSDNRRAHPKAFLMKSIKVKRWAQHAALTIYKVESGIPLDRDVRKIVLSYWARVIQQSHDGIGKRDCAPARA